MTHKLRSLFPRSINQRQLAAGMAWFEDWVTGGSIVTPISDTARPSVKGSGGKIEQQSKVEAAERFREVSQSINDPDIRRIVVAVVLHEENLGDMAEQLSIEDGVARCSGHVAGMLKTGLDRVAACYSRIERRSQEMA